MIKKFIKIEGTGKFLKYAPNLVPVTHRTTDFEKINLIYGENGSGKTTLSVILRSLKSNSPLLSKKRAFDKSIPQTIEILRHGTPATKHTFENNAWDSHYPNIEIFDIHFINENIYTGLEIQNSHKKNLFEIIFGQQGIQLKTDIQNIKEKIQETNQAVSKTSADIQKIIDNAYNANNFCKLEEDPEIEVKISAKQAEIITAKSFQAIQVKSGLIQIPQIILPYNYEEAISTISQSITTIKEEYLKKFNDHKNHLNIEEAEDWLKQGLTAIKENSCPFCLQSLDSVEIIEAYNQYFNEEYKALLQALSKLNRLVSNFNLEASILEIEARIISNQGLIEFWKTHVKMPPAIKSIIDKKSALLSALDAMKTVFKEKSLNPVESKDTTAIKAFQDLVNDFNKLIDDFNAGIALYNTNITTLKSSNSPSVQELETQLKKFIAIKMRAVQEMKDRCTKLAGEIQEVERLNIEKNTKQGELDTYSATIFGNYTSSINNYLQAFAPYLSIQGLDSGYVGTSKEPMIKYALHIDGNEIAFEDSSTLPTFKYSLSEGDKTALALAFFLTKIELDGNLQDKIIIFDDPVSSFDLNRKSTTISKLVYFGQQAKQLFVFTHNIIFAGDFWKSVNQISVTSQCSKIEFFGNTSCIVEFNIDNETLSSVLKDSMTIKNYLSTGALSDEHRRTVARCLRPALESYFHLKFFDLVLPNDWLGDFIGKVRSAATPADRFHRLQTSLSELQEINDYSKKYHHRFNALNDSEPVNNAELINYCNRTLNLIQVI
jgi:wobble nucleotide-excising tRNase